jgi:hypothetical protein
MTIIEELELRQKVINVRGGRGYGVGHPHAPRQISGYGVIDPTEKAPEEYINKPVKVSRAFRK